MATNINQSQKISAEPYYLAQSDEIELFEAAAAERIPVLLKGATGTGKTRFVEYMTWRLRNRWSKEQNSEIDLPLSTISCHEDLTASDLVGRFLLDGTGTKWIDGPLTRVVRGGGLCYLDEFVEARKDTTVIIHSLTDYRRLLVIDKLAEEVKASPNFMMVLSYNPKYQNVHKEMKHSTRQRFVAIEFNFPEPEMERKIIEREAGITTEIAGQLADLGKLVRQLEDRALEETVSTRSLIYAGRLIKTGILPRRACQTAISLAMTDDTLIQTSIDELVKAVFAE